MTIESTSIEQTKHVAADFAKQLNGGDVVFLEGDLGSGKTTFVQEVMEAFGYKEPVRSPTFSIMNRYKIDHPSIETVIHLDFYRFEDPSEIRSLGLDELYGHRTIVFIEWPSKGETLLSVFGKSHHVVFQQLPNNHHQIIFS